MSHQTELVFILDKSGSMAGLESDTIGGFNGFIEKQKKEEGDVRLTTVLFNNDIQLLHDRLDLKAIHPLTENDYQVGGSTSLLDAIGFSIQKIIQVQKQSSKAYRADKVIFVITTDGMENSSREFSVQKIKALIEHQEQKYHWEFLFLGANIDAISTANKMGIRTERAVEFFNDSKGIQTNYKVLNEAVSDLRSQKEIADKWKGEIERELAARKMNKGKH